MTATYTYLSAAPSPKIGAPKLPGAPDPPPRYIGWVLVLATSLLARAAAGYRPFPSIDDFSYIPMAWAAADASLYPRDEILQGFLVHAPVWQWVVRGAELTVGVPLAFWLLTFVLTVATVGAAYRILRALGVPGLLLPLAVVLGFAGRVTGIGRGAYDGALGDAFHVQWLALALLLWAYDAFVRERPLTTGVLLGLTTIVHPVVALHGAIVMVLATPFAGRGAWSRLFATGLVCGVVSLPATVPIVTGLLGGAAFSDMPTAALIRDAYLFRAPHHYALDTLPPAVYLVVGLTVAVGLAAAYLVGPLRPRPAGAVTGLFIGHVVLLGLAFLFHGPWLPATMTHASIAPYLLDLTRTSALVFVLAALLSVATVEAGLALGLPSTRASRVLWWALIAALLTLAVLAEWRLAHVVAVAGGLGLGVLWRRGRDLRLPTAGLAVAGLAALAWSATRDVREAAVSPPETELFTWARSATRPADLFIVPPGLEGFRLYARRGVYVDFKTFPVSTPRAAGEWRRRLNLIAAPDRLAREAEGWDGVPLWDRSYANRNTPERIADLLARTGAEYFVWDSAGLEVPPFAPVERRRDSRITRVFANARFEVYRLGSGRARRP